MNRRRGIPLLSILAIAMMLPASCHTHEAETPDPKGPVAPTGTMDYRDAGAEDETDAETASLSLEGKACRRLRDFKCPEGNRSKLGTACVEWMRVAGKLNLVRTQCIAEMKTRADLVACNVRCVE